MSIIVEVYSEKAIVVRNTLEHHGTVMQSLGGTFNDRLKGGRGWIFPKHMFSQVKNAAEKLNSGQYGNEFEQKSNSVVSDGVSKTEYLSLLSRVERLEAIISNLGHTQLPFTQLPSTQLPSTQLPSTQLPSTQLPSTQLPSTQLPSTPLTLSKPKPKPKTKMEVEVEIDDEEPEEPFERKRLVSVKK